MGKHDTTKEWSAGCDRDASARRSATACSASPENERYLWLQLENARLERERARAALREIREGIAAGSATVEPLKAVEWQFPLGSCHARLSIVAGATGEITPEDMDALTEIASLMKRQLVRRQGESQSDQTTLELR